MAHLDFRHADYASLVGNFRHAETGVYFDYHHKPNWPIDGYPFGIVMCDGSTRTAKILKTVAYVAIDEDENGLPVFEKWPLKDHKQLA
jgi:hypothetical protein